ARKFFVGRNWPEL
nr:RecName: Full=36 kDa cell wall protein [Arabidopsis thaliana]